ncbi:hypothetical protein CYMTET_5028 [Cymbomonas tetramitiformis]|uniref:Uncharacterized protein n=1 Tax=Cymbomonas tetramitiformis TaxID=36881 RepID=A0AAE0LJH9_9CHLO|nr:hypothetical protein CYMTET_5028 [Cymbomonas tetramitiformis]
MKFHLALSHSLGFAYSALPLYPPPWLVTDHFFHAFPFGAATGLATSTTGHLVGPPSFLNPLTPFGEVNTSVSTGKYSNTTNNPASIAGITSSSQNLSLGQKGSTNTAEVVLGVALFSRRK